MTVPVTQYYVLLNAQNAVGDGSTIDFGTIQTNGMGIYYTNTGGDITGEWEIQMSVDGSIWVVALTGSPVGSAGYTTQPGVYRYLKGTVVTAPSGGNTVTVQVVPLP